MKVGIKMYTDSIIGSTKVMLTIQTYLSLVAKQLWTLEEINVLRNDVSLELFSAYVMKIDISVWNKREDWSFE